MPACDACKAACRSQGRFATPSAALPDRREEAVGADAGAARAAGTVALDQRLGGARHGRAPAPRRPAAARTVGMGGVELARDVLVLGLEQAAGGIDQPPARLQQARRARQDRAPA